MYSKDYDSKLYLESVNNFHSTVKFPKNVEPGILKIFDIFSNEESQGSDLDGSDEKGIVRMLSLEDDAFVLDKAIYKSCTHENH